MRPLAPLWARAVLAAALASVAARQSAGAEPGVWLLAGVLLIAALACVGALAWPALSWRRAAAPALAGALGVAIGAWTGRPALDPGLVLSPRAWHLDHWRIIGTWATLLAGAAAALLPRANDARLSLARRGALVLGGALTTAIVAGLAWWGARRGLSAMAWLRPLAGEVTAGLFGAGLALGVEAGARLSRRMGPATAIALVLAAYGVLGLTRGGLRASAEVRTDTGDVRYYWVGLPFLPVSLERGGEPQRSRRLDAARAAPALAPAWQACALADLPQRRRLLEHIADWGACDGRIARMFLVDLAAAPDLDRDDVVPLLHAIVTSREGRWESERWIREYCRAKGYNPFAPDEDVHADADGLTARLRHGTFDERARAATRLGRAFPLAAQPPLTAALDDPAPEVRIAAATALGAMLDPAVLPALRAAREREAAAARGEGPPRDPESARVEGETLPALDAAIRAVVEAGSVR